MQHTSCEQPSFTPCFLSIGHSNSSASSGIQADIRAAQALGGYAACAVTAITIENSYRVESVISLLPEVVSQQMDSILRNFPPLAIKTGMLGTAEVIYAVGDFIDSLEKQNIPVVVDPVMVGYGYWPFLDKEARDALKKRLMLRARVLTPNIPEAEELTGLSIRDVEGMCHAAEMLLSLGAQYVLIKGGSLKGEQIDEVLAGVQEGIEIFHHPRAENVPTHGASTVLSAGITLGLAQGMSVRESYIRASHLVHTALNSGRSLSENKNSPIILPACYA